MSVLLAERPVLMVDHKAVSLPVFLPLDQELADLVVKAQIVS